MQSNSITCVNGRFVAADEAVLPIADRGFRFGDGVFETIRLVSGVPYQWELHIGRLHAGLDALRICPPELDWHAIARTLITKNRASDGFLRLSVSRGVGSHGYLPIEGIKAHWAMEHIPAMPMPDHPFTLFISSVTRPALTCLPANHKLAQGVSSTLALMEARDQQCDDALMLSHDGQISEASSGNLFWISGNRLFTPALTTACLAGTTRAAVMRLSGVSVHEVSKSVADIADADAMFISNARLGVWPVSALLPVGRTFDCDHPVIHQLQAQLLADRDNYTAMNLKAWQ
jgi:branched-subunit amino acid aminotransferase/4-amino-4-deoxychorismate lyase